jgi:hypothetical protein
LEYDNFKTQNIEKIENIKNESPVKTEDTKLLNNYDNNESENHFNTTIRNTENETSLLKSQNDKLSFEILENKNKINQLEQYTFEINQNAEKY